VRAGIATNRTVDRPVQAGNYVALPLEAMMRSLCLESGGHRMSGVDLEAAPKGDL
jgi:hypothetical protein